MPSTNGSNNRHAQPSRGTPLPPEDGAKPGTPVQRPAAAVRHVETRSGTRPAGGNHSSGTSGRVSAEDLSTDERSENRGLIPAPESLGEFNVPDVPDAANSENGSAGRGCFPPDRGSESASAEPDCSTAEQQQQQQQPPVVIRGVLRLGAMQAPRDTFLYLQNPDIRELLLRDDVIDDAVILADRGTEFSVLDCDSHDWAEAPSDDAIQEYLADIHPVPDAAWASHGRGLKMVYTGRAHKERTLAAAFSVPRSFSVELLTYTRHPRSRSTQHPGRRCGRVAFFDAPRDEPFVFRAVGPPTEEIRAQALQSLGLTGASRFDHNRCPIDSTADSDARQCVVVLDSGVFCHRCASHGFHYRDQSRPGYLPFTKICAAPLNHLGRLAGHLVHWEHAKLDLRRRFPRLHDGILRLAYWKTLEAILSISDPRISMVFNMDLDFVWGPGIWLDSKQLAPTLVDNDAASGLPCCHVFSTVGGSKKLILDRTKRSRVKNRTPQGYRPVRPVRGITFSRDTPEEIPVILPPLPRHAIELLGNPLDECDAFEILGADFHRVDRRYLMACLAAGVCGEAIQGQPPMLLCTGPSGSGKEQHIRLAASFLGEDIIKLSLGADDEPFKRQIGVALTSGHRFLVLDELGKEPRLMEKLRLVLQISASVNWRPLYANKLLSTPVRAAFFFPCVRFPGYLGSSQEFNRRTRACHLHRRLPNWHATSGGDTVSWRDRTPENAHAANSILTHVWRLCHDHGFQFL